ncbi:MAG: RNA-binding protein [Hyphomicrobiales bacterium]|uniref:RNA-binding protein n=1 Tax=Rhabdaerophilum calidifontis TaxID=2604328 RepID=UPI00123C4006|nr:RNA-binding protein [Rhabdaerophilum calidifontis]MCA1953421.1 RNA-binding protein [Hyphomicrobiales bacterium]MCA1999636.1 RNA-binding protein [Hyphomicrobiales bacterium]
MEPDETEGAREDRRAVSRRCAVTREIRPIDRLLRFVAAPDGALVPDIRNRLPGRGVWIGNDRALLAEAIRRKLFGRALKAEIRVPADLDRQVAGLLRADALQMLALANKAGAVTSGFAKIDGLRGPVLALVEASDGSEAEIARLAGRMAGRGPRQGDPLVIRVFSAEEIALSLGREHVIHAALAVHPAGSAFLDRAARYVEFLSGGPATRDGATPPGSDDAFQVPRNLGSDAGDPHP